MPNHIINDLAALLRAEATISALVGTKVFGFHVPEEFGPPFVVIEQISSDEMLALDGTYGMRMIEVDIDCKAERSVTSTEISRVVRAYLQDYSGTAGDHNIDAVLLRSERTQYEPPTDKSDVGIYTTLLDFSIQHTPA